MLRRRTDVRRILLAGAILAAALSGCSDSGTPHASLEASPSTVDELALHDGKVCPRRLPTSEENNGFGTGTRATRAPSLPPLDQAWVCTYRPLETGRDAEQGATYQWPRTAMTRVPDTSMADLRRLLGELTLFPDGDLSCTADLGSRHLLVYRSGRDLTGVVVDDFGCDDVRLTEDPFVTEPGASTHPGIVPGVLRGPPKLAGWLSFLTEQGSPPLVEDRTAQVAADLTALATEFVRYARDEATTFPHADTVSFAIGGHVYRWVDDFSAALADPHLWRSCPSDWTAYAGADCPLHFLGPIRDVAIHGVQLVYGARFEDFLCAPPREGPPPSGRFVVLRPASASRSCASNFALVLNADEGGRLTGVDLTLAEP